MNHFMFWVILILISHLAYSAFYYCSVMYHDGKFHTKKPHPFLAKLRNLLLYVFMGGEFLFKIFIGPFDYLREKHLTEKHIAAQDKLTELEKKNSFLNKLLEEKIDDNDDLVHQNEYLNKILSLYRDYSTFLRKNSNSWVKEYDFNSYREDLHNDNTATRHKNDRPSHYLHAMVETDRGSIGIDLNKIADIQNENRPKQPYEEQKKRVISNLMSRLWDENDES